MGLVRWIKGRPAPPKEQHKGARPLRNPAIESVDLPDGSVMLNVPLEASGKPWLAYVARWAKAPTHRQVELEPIGASVWKLADGAHTFESISKELRERYKMNRMEADASLGAFLTMLGRRGLVLDANRPPKGGKP